MLRHDIVFKHLFLVKNARRHLAWCLYNSQHGIGDGSDTLEEARDLAGRAIKFKADRGRLPLVTAADPWERRLAEGIAFLQRKTAEAKNG